jgi:Fe-S cluster assembly protein SufB
LPNGQSTLSAPATELDLGPHKLGWIDAEHSYVYKPKKGLSEDIVKEMSWMKGEPQWMTDRRLKGLRHFQKRPMPNWGGDMSETEHRDENWR